MAQISRTPLEPHEVRDALTQLQGWTGNEHGIEKKLTFRDFRQTITFINACVDGIEERQHHPVWTNKYNSLDIHLDTFDAGHRVTKKDIDLAKFLDSVLAAIQSGRS